MDLQPFTARYGGPFSTGVTPDSHSMNAFHHVLSGYSPISLSQMQNVTLLRRVDSKYVLSEAQLNLALAKLSGAYDVLEIEGQHLHHYKTLYYDTPDFMLYLQHHAGCRKRYKVRTRTYMDSGLAFLEVKQKTNKDITIKHRQQTPRSFSGLDKDAKDFLRTCFPYNLETLEPTLGNTFRRITLVSKHGIERLTLDINLGFQANGKVISLPCVAIAEVKQEAFSLHSEFIGQMRALGVRAMRFSKYCTGIALLYEQVKSNNFKPQRLYVDKLIKEGISKWTIS